MASKKKPSKKATTVDVVLYGVNSYCDSYDDYQTHISALSSGWTSIPAKQFQLINENSHYLARKLGHDDILIVCKQNKIDIAEVFAELAKKIEEDEKKAEATKARKEAAAKKRAETAEKKKKAKELKLLKELQNKYK